MPRLRLALFLGALLAALPLPACDDGPPPSSGTTVALATYRDGCTQADCGTSPAPAHPCVGGYPISVCTKARGTCGWQVECGDVAPPDSPGPDVAVRFCGASPQGVAECGPVPAFEDLDCVWGFLGEPACEGLGNEPCSWKKRCRAAPCDRTGTCNTLDRSKVGALCGVGAPPCPAGSSCLSIGVNLGESVPASCVTGNPCEALTCVAGRQCAVLTSFPGQLVCGK